MSYFFTHQLGHSALKKQLGHFVLKKAAWASSGVVCLIYTLASYVWDTVSHLPTDFCLID